MVNTNQTHTAVEFGDTFYLRSESGKYLVAADKGRYFFPQLDNKDGERLQIVGDNKELQHNDEIKIRSLETRLGERDILGAFPDSHNCYYWNDGYDDRQQSWKITKASGKLGIIHYGEEVVLTNVYYDKQTLAADTKHPDYLTTDKNAKEVWILESTEKISAANSITSKPKTVFDLSVASGDPTPTGVVLWTRINPESDSYGNDIPVQYQVAPNRDFDELLIEGTVAASDINEKTDSRSFRDKPNLEINQKILAKVKEYRVSHPELQISDAMAAVRKQMNLHDWQASMLGKDQREWLIEGVTKSDANWKVWGNQTLLATSTLNEKIGEIDDWHGFKAERYEILQAVKERETKIRGNDKSRFVVLTGDMHTSLIAYLKTETDSWASDLATSSTLGNFGSAIKNAGKGLWSGVTLDLPSVANNLGEGAKNLAAGGINAAENLGSGIMHPLETSQKIAEDGVNNLNYDYSKLAGVEFMTPGLTSPGLSEYIYVSAENEAGDLEKKLGINLAPVTETVGAAASSVLESASSLLSSVVPDVIEDAVETARDKVSTHKLATANVIKRFSPHIEHFDSSVNGYAIAKFTKEKMHWYVYAIDKTIYDKADDGRNLSTHRAEKKLVQSATYNPDGISLDD